MRPHGPTCAEQVAQPLIEFEPFRRSRAHSRLLTIGSPHTAAGPAWYVRDMLLDLTDPEKDALLTLVMEAIEAAPPSPQTDLLHSVLAKLGADTAGQAIDPAAPLDEAVLTALRELRREGQPDVLAMVIRLFRESGPTILSDMTAAVASDDAVLLLSASHKLRGISANVGARLLAGRCRQIEASARMGIVPDNAAAQVEAIALEYERAQAALTNWYAANP
jgi:HPt (histidine-containing phosphotransfer) domain-containing protein